ncbi:MAG TPA: hypothetical protein VHL58_03145 [Thermoanaerobaculia bacterium]|nr:hypothetical protein [Thermoanaerobaculia bacterium]
MTTNFTFRQLTDLPLDTVEVVGTEKTGSPLPLAIVLHGRGADNRDLSDLVPYIDPLGQWRFLFPNAPKPFQPGPGYSFGFTWFDGWPPDRESVGESRKVLQRYIDEVQKLFAVDDSRTLLAGFSQGAMMSLDSGFRRSGNLAGIVVMSGGIYEEELPELKSHSGTPVLILHGTEDDVLPVLLARRTRRVLEDHGVEPEYHEFPMAHQVSEESMAKVAEFLERVKPG